MKNYLVLILLFLTFGVFSQEEKPVKVPVIAMKIPLNKAVTIDGGVFTFLDVVEDSRCPKNTTCVWEGRAIVKVSILLPDGTNTIKELEFKNASTPDIGSIGDTSLVALQLAPYPDDDIPPAERAPYTLLVKKEIAQ